MTSAVVTTGMIGNTYKTLFRKQILRMQPPAVGLAVAYVSASGFSLVKHILEEGGVDEVRLVTDTKDGVTHPKALQGAVDSGWNVRVVDDLAGTFHPKLYVGAANFDDDAGVPDLSLAIIGSPNLSRGGFLKNGECVFWSVAPHNRKSAAKAWMNCWNAGARLTPGMLAAYEKHFALRNRYRKPEDMVALGVADNLPEKADGAPKKGVTPPRAGHKAIAETVASVAWAGLQSFTGDYTLQVEFPREAGLVLLRVFKDLAQDDRIDIRCTDGEVRDFKYRFYEDNGMFRLNIPNTAPLVAWAREHKQGIAYVEHNEEQGSLYFAILAPGKSMMEIVDRSLALGTWGANAHKTIRLVLMGSDKKPALASGAAMDQEGPENDKAKLVVLSDDVAARRRDVLRNFLMRGFPECLSEGRIDFKALRRALGDWVEEGNERFGLAWPGKAHCMSIIQQPSVATLRPDRSESVDFESTDNVFIEGENLEVLKLLQKSYFGKIKMIYIDPPYNTGQEFIYSDKYAESLEAYLTYTGQIDSEGRRFATNTDTVGRYHSNWLNMMYPRLYLARNLLREDGAIFISIDDHELSHLRELCDQVFGEENFKADITWQKRYTRSNSTIDFTSVVEHLLVYAKSEAFEVSLLSRTKEADARYSNPDDDPRGDWKGASFLSPSSPQERPNLCYPLKNPNTGEVVLPTTNAWRRSKEAFEELLADKRLYWGPDGKASVPSIKMFLSEARGLTPTNFWAHDYAGHTDEGTRDLEALIPGKVFNNPKPVRLVRRMLEHACNGPGDIVLDFFAGSGVTAQATIELNLEDGGSRKFVLVQLPEPAEAGSNAAKAGFSTIAEIGRERIRSVIDKARKASDGQLPLDQGSVADLGFKAFRLDQSNFRIWDGPGDPADTDELARQLELHVEHRRSESTPEDIAYEILLKSGFPLSTKVEAIKLAGSDLFAIADGALLICLEKDITAELIDAIAETDPLQVICLDEGFKGNDQLKANAVQAFKARSASRETEIVFRTV